ncbi:hypothetical protein LOD99_5785 [Oopsacas minuta]|uniref:BZIP domain-containing protein n=1 Tax=Oopsacas minuta TaxID=111878 RepID=A0AAV7JRF6_9METZ|nr:hypothetical protein LOD99_5785 [Oopsacas minuta]
MQYREQDYFPTFPNYREQPSYFDSDRKPQINKNVHLSCNIPGGQHQMDQTNFYYGAGGNHQVPGSEDSINYDTSSNEFYAEMPKHNLPHVIHSDEMYQGAFPPTSHSQILPIPISEGSTSSLPVSLTPFTLSNGSAPTSPSVGYEHEQSHFIQTSTSGGFPDPMMSPYPADAYQQFSYDGAMQGANNRVGKDLKYCERRRKNNEASKKSRAKKKEKAREMESRAHVLEQENRHLRQKYSELEQEVAVYKQLTEKITNCESQECNTPAYLALQQLRGDQARTNTQFPE